MEVQCESGRIRDGPDPEAVEHLMRRFDSLGEAFCTTCGYCLEHCPEKIQIQLFAGLWDRVRMQLPDEARRVYRFYQSDEERWLKGKPGGRLYTVRRM